MVSQSSVTTTGTDSRGVPRWISSRLSSDQISKIENEIKSAELKTSGELVVVISARTFPLRSLEVLSGFIFIVLTVAGIEPILGDWLTYLDIFLLTLGVIVAGGCGYALAKTSWFRRFLLNDRDSAMLASHRAELEFYRAGIGRTENKTGILIYLALQDHEVVVLADQGISSKLPTETWHEVVKMILDGIKNNDLASGLLAAVARSGEILSSHFPVSSGDRNELSNHLIFKD